MFGKDSSCYLEDTRCCNISINDLYHALACYHNSELDKTMVQRTLKNVTLMSYPSHTNNYMVDSGRITHLHVDA